MLSWPAHMRQDPGLAQNDVVDIGELPWMGAPWGAEGGIGKWGGLGGWQGEVEGIDI